MIDVTATIDGERAVAPVREPLAAGLGDQVGMLGASAKALKRGGSTTGRFRAHVTFGPPAALTQL